MLTWATWCTAAARNLQSVVVSCSALQDTEKAFEDASLLYLRDCRNLKVLIISPSSAPHHQHTQAIFNAVGRNKSLHDFRLLCTLQPFLTQAVGNLLRAKNNVTSYHFEFHKEVIFHGGRVAGHHHSFPPELYGGLAVNQTLTSLTLQGKPGRFNCDATDLVRALAKSGSIHAIAGFGPTGKRDSLAITKQLMVNKAVGRPQSDHELLDRVAAASIHPDAVVSLESTMRLLHNTIALDLFQGTIEIPALIAPGRSRKRQRVNEQGVN